MKKAIEGSQGKNARFTDNSDPSWWNNPHYLPSVPSKIPSNRRARSASRTRGEITGKITDMEAPALQPQKHHSKLTSEASKLTPPSQNGMDYTGSPPTMEVGRAPKNRPSSAGNRAASQNLNTKEDALAESKNQNKNKNSPLR